jgi:hypothetical protein
MTATVAYRVSLMRTRTVVEHCDVYVHTDKPAPNADEIATMVDQVEAGAEWTVGSDTADAFVVVNTEQITKR